MFFSFTFGCGICFCVFSVPRCQAAFGFCMVFTCHYVCNHFQIRLLTMMRWRISTNGTMPMEIATWSCCWRRNGARALSLSASATRCSLTLLGSACSAVIQVGATPSGNLWKFVFVYFVVFLDVYFFTLCHCWGQCGRLPILAAFS